MSSASKGLLLGGLGVLIFSITMPATKIALAGGALSPWFIWSGRGVLAAFAGMLYLRVSGKGWPPKAARWSLVFGWPLLNTLALQTVSSGHSAVINGVLPLATAITGAVMNRERLPRVFWLCALAGTGLVCGYAWLHAAGALQLPDALLFIGVLFGSLGYACGARAVRHMGGAEVISWALIVGLPVTLPSLWANQPTHWEDVQWQSGFAFLYLGLMSQWIGFFFWYWGLHLGGIARVSQIQLMQLFLTLGFSALLLGETIEPLMLIVAVLTVALIFIGRRSREAPARRALP